MDYKLTSDEMHALHEIDVVNADLIARNQERLTAAKEALGEKYCMHPANAVGKLLPKTGGIRG